MSALQLLEQLGASAPLQRVGNNEAEKHRKRVSSALDDHGQIIHKWCLLLPAEDDNGDQAPDETPSDNENEIRLH